MVNIFYSDSDPFIAAANLDNKRVARMAFESDEAIQGAILNALYGDKRPETRGRDDPPYWNLRMSRRHHPCVLWVGKSIHNAQWLLEHFEALVREHSRRYNTNKLKVAKHLSYCKEMISVLPHKPFTEPLAVMPDFIATSRVKITARYKISLVHRYLYLDKRSTVYTGSMPKFVADQRIRDFLLSEVGKPCNAEPVLKR